LAIIKALQASIGFILFYINKLANCHQTVTESERHIVQNGAPYSSQPSRKKPQFIKLPPDSSGKNRNTWSTSLWVRTLQR